jgi:hypothetical protein
MALFGKNKKSSFFFRRQKRGDRASTPHDVIVRCGRFEMIELLG